MIALQNSQLQHIPASAHHSIRHVHSPLFHSTTESPEMEGGCPAVTKHRAKPILSSKRWLKKQYLTHHNCKTHTVPHQTSSQGPVAELKGLFVPEPSRSRICFVKLWCWKRTTVLGSRDTSHSPLHAFADLMHYTVIKPHVIEGVALNSWIDWKNSVFKSSLGMRTVSLTAPLPELLHLTNKIPPMDFFSPSSHNAFLIGEAMEGITFLWTKPIPRNFFY